MIKIHNNTHRTFFFKHILWLFLISLNLNHADASTIVLSDDYSLALFARLSNPNYEGIFELNKDSDNSKNERYDFLLDEINYAPLSKQEFLSYRFFGDKEKSWPSLLQKLSSQKIIHPVRVGETTSDISYQLLRLSKMKLELANIKIVMHAFGIMDICQSSDDPSSIPKNLKKSLDYIEKFFKPLNQKMNIIILGMPAPGVSEKSIEQCFDSKNKKSIRMMLKEKFSDSSSKQIIWETLNVGDHSPTDRCALLSPYLNQNTDKGKNLSSLANHLDDYRQTAKNLVDEKNKDTSSLLRWHFIDASKKIFWKEADTIYNCFDLNPESSYQFAEFLNTELKTIESSTTAK